MDDSVASRVILKDLNRLIERSGWATSEYIPGILTLIMTDFHEKFPPRFQQQGKCSCDPSDHFKPVFPAIESDMRFVPCDLRFELLDDLAVSDIGRIGGNQIETGLSSQTIGRPPASREDSRVAQAAAT